jgi:hypothetical protein
LRVSYLEIYKEQLRDLLIDEGESKDSQSQAEDGLRIREDKKVSPSPSRGTASAMEFVCYVDVSCFSP